MIEIHPLTPHIGGRLTGIDARKPLSASEVAAIDAGMDKHAVLVLPAQNITDEQQLAFSRNFGPLEEGANSGARDSDLRLPVVFADVSMPGLDGLQLVSALKAWPHLAHIPVVMLTALVQRAQREEADRQGVAGYLTKPFSPAELRASVDVFAGMAA